MRGKLHEDDPLVDLARNIPAYAGKTATHNRAPGIPEEHPRVCGENHVQNCAVVRPWGTSPRMRGKQIFSFSLVDDSRNIPAYAGKTLNFHLNLEPDTEHPRVCGENFHF